MKANEGTQDRIGDGSGNRAGTGTRTDIETRGRAQNRNGDGNGDKNESSSGEGNGNGDGERNEDRIGEGGGGGEAKKRKNLHKDCKRDVENGGDLYGVTRKRREESVDSDAAYPDNLENSKDVGNKEQNTQDFNKILHK